MASAGLLVAIVLALAVGIIGNVSVQSTRPADDDPPPARARAANGSQEHPLSAFEIERSSGPSAMPPVDHSTAEATFRVMHKGSPVKHFNVSLDIEEDWRVVHTHSLTTDDNGFVSVQGEKGQVAILRVDTSGWRIVQPSLLRAFVPSRRGTPCPIGGATRVLVEVERVVCIDIVARYEDGTPYVGVGTTAVEGSVGRSRLDFVGGECSFVASEGGKYKLRLPSRRPHFADVMYEVSLPVWQPEEPFRIDVSLRATSDPGGVIELDLRNFAQGTPLLIGVRGRSNVGTNYAASGSGGRSHVTGVLRPGDYLISVYVDRSQSQNERVEPASILYYRQESIAVKDGQVTRVTPIPVETGILTARIVDSEGIPLVGARFGPLTDTYTSWKLLGAVKPGSSSRTPGTFAISGEDGVAVLRDVYPSPSMFVAEARGYEPKRCPLSPVSGQTIDAGTFVLTRAEGTIEIVVAEPVEGADYEVYLFQPGGVALQGPLRFSGRTFVIESLPLRRYTVSVSRVGGGYTAKSQNVTLDPPQPAKRLEFFFKPLVKEVPEQEAASPSKD